MTAVSHDRAVVLYLTMPWGERVENERAWRVPIEQIAANGYNLDVKNPSAKEDFAHLPPEQLADDILAKERRIAEIMGEIKAVLAEVNV